MIDRNWEQIWGSVPYLILKAVNMRLFTVYIVSVFTLVAGARAVTNAAWLAEMPAVREGVCTVEHGDGTRRAQGTVADEDAGVGPSPTRRSVKLGIQRRCSFSVDGAGRLFGRVQTYLGIDDILDGCQVQFSPDGAEVDRVSVYEAGVLVADWVPRASSPPEATNAAWVAEMPTAPPLLFPWSEPKLALSTNQQGVLSLQVSGVQTSEAYISAATPFLRKHTDFDETSSVRKDKDTGEMYIMARNDQKEERIHVVTDLPFSVLTRQGAWLYVESNGRRNSGDFERTDEIFLWQGINPVLGGKDGILTIQEETMRLQGKVTRTMVTGTFANYLHDGHWISFRDYEPYRGAMHPDMDTQYDKGFSTGRVRLWNEEAPIGLNQYTEYTERGSLKGCSFSMDRRGRLVGGIRTFLGYKSTLDGCQVLFSLDGVDRVSVYEAGSLIADWCRENDRGGTNKVATSKNGTD